MQERARHARWVGPTAVPPVASAAHAPSTGAIARAATKRRNIMSQVRHMLLADVASRRGAEALEFPGLCGALFRGLEYRLDPFRKVLRCQFKQFPSILRPWVHPELACTLHDCLNLMGV